MRISSPLGSFVARDTPAARVDARVKIVLLLAATVSAFATGASPALALWAVLLVASWGLARMDPRSFLGALAPVAVILAFTPPQLADACTRLMSPLRRIGVPVAEIGLMLSLALRFIPIVSEEFDRIRLAQRSRGVDFDRGGVVARVRAWASVLTPLVVSLFRRADRLGESMAARCYADGAPAAERTPLPARDRVVLAAGLAVCLAIPTAAACI